MHLTIVTFNIYNRADFDDRLPAISATLAAARADVVCLQEVPPEAGRTAALAEACDYAHFAEVLFARPDDGWSEGLGLLSRQPILEREPVDLRPGVPNCFRALLDIGGAVAIYNTHLHPRDSELRQREAAVIMERMARDPALPAVLCGDFNAVAGGKTMGVVWPHLTSAFEMANGQHPQTTFPTPLRPLAERTPGFSARREGPPTDDERDARAAIDHVLVRPAQFRALRASVIGERVDGVRPSDHYGVRVELEG